MNNILQIMTNAVFARYTIITTLLFTALSTYVSASAYIVGEIYGQPRLFPWIFAAIGLAMAICTLINSRLSTRFGARRVIRSLLSFYTGIAVLLLLATFFWHMRPPIGVFFTGVGLLMAVNLAIEPNCSALALEPMAHKAGMASAVYGTFFFFIGSGLGTFITHLLQHGVWPLVISFVLFGTLSLLLSKRPRSVADRPAQHT